MINGLDQTDSGRLNYMGYGYFRLLLYDIHSESQATKKITDLFIQFRACPGENSFFEIFTFPLSFFEKGK